MQLPFLKTVPDQTYRVSSDKLSHFFQHPSTDEIDIHYNMSAIVYCGGSYGQFHKFNTVSGLVDLSRHESYNYWKA